ncbi:MAG: 4'-phosphopantetheinyl transferase family protein [Planctomycetota bacterium]
MNDRSLPHEYGGPREDVLAELNQEAPSRWLSPAELDWFGKLKGERRRNDWLAGRWCVKRLLPRIEAVESRLGIDQRLSRRDVSVLSTNPRGQASRPTLYFAGMASWLAISIAHSDRQVCAAIAPWPQARVGIDVVDRVEHCSALAATWFTPREQALVARRRDPLDTLRIWSAKEASYKALVSNRAFEPLSIEVELESSYAGEARIKHGLPAGQHLRTARILWRDTSHGLRTLAFAQEQLQ